MLGLRLFLNSLFFLYCFNAFSFVPKAGQILRFQPQVLRAQKALKIKGSAIPNSNQKIPYEILWADQGEYQITISQIPRSFFFSDSQKASNWVLKRHPKTGCSLTVEGINYTCDPINFWAYSELSGMPDTTAKSYAAAGFIPQSESAFEETDGRLLGAIPAFERNGQAQTPTVISSTSDFRNSRVQPAMGLNGNTPTAVLQIKGENFTSPQDKIEEGYPLLQLDPTFLVPTLARWKANGQIFTIKAQSDVEVRRRRPRFTYVIASKMDVFEGANFLGAFERKEPEVLSKSPNLGASPKNLTDISTLRNLLSTEGQSFLTSLMLTH